MAIPKAEIAYDKFHLIKAMDERLDQVVYGHSARAPVSSRTEAKPFLSQ